MPFSQEMPLYRTDRTVKGHFLYYGQITGYLLRAGVDGYYGQKVGVYQQKYSLCTNSRLCRTEKQWDAEEAKQRGLFLYCVVMIRRFCMYPA